MGGTCSTCERDEKLVQNFGWTSCRKEYTRRIYENNNRMYPKETGQEVVDWIHIAQDRNNWRNFVNTVISLWLSQRRRTS